MSQKAQWTQGGGSTKTKTRTDTEAYVDDIRLENLQSKLPKNVFLVSISAATARSTKQDKTFVVGNERMATPNYPYDWTIPGKIPIMNEQRAYFENPAQDPPRGKSPWTFKPFFDKYNEMMKQVGGRYSSVVDRTYIKGIAVVEVHNPNYCSIDSTGRKSWDWNSMSKQNAQMGIATFAMRDKGFKNEKVKKKLSSSLAGDTKKPIKLVEARLVTCKTPPHDDRSKKYHYYTDKEYGSLYSKSEKCPDILDCEEKPINRATKGKSGKASVSKYIPSLVSNDFAKVSELSGPVKSKQDFEPDDVSFL